MNGSQGLRRGLLQYAGMFFALSALVLFFSLRTKTFWSATTLTTIANSIPDLTVVAVGMTLILILGGIDLSVGSVMAWSGSVMAMLMVDQGWPVAGAVVAALLVGTVCGCINGWISSRFRIPSFIVTLGMLEIARGGAYLATRSETKYLGPRLEWLSEPWLGIGLRFGCSWF